MAEQHPLPQLSNAGLAATRPGLAMDEYGRTRELQIACERALTLYLDRHQIVTLMTLGTHPELLALGYLKNQALLQELGQVRRVQVDWETEAAVISTYTGEGARAVERMQQRTVTTGCGQGTSFGELRTHIEQAQLPVPSISQSQVYALLRTLGRYNPVYRAAGAVHGCALCRGPEILYFVEDVGRHNAVDAISGHMWMHNIEGADKWFYTTGRLTSEMVIKVVQMGIPVLLSRSGITGMALELAQRANIVLLARAQRQHFLVYHGREYLSLDVELPPKRAVAHMRAG